MAEGDKIITEPMKGMGDGLPADEAGVAYSDTLDDFRQKVNGLAFDLQNQTEQYAYFSWGGSNNSGKFEANKYHSMYFQVGWGKRTSDFITPILSNDNPNVYNLFEIEEAGVYEIVTEIYAWDFGSGNDLIDDMILAWETSSKGPFNNLGYNENFTATGLETWGYDEGTWGTGARMYRNQTSKYGTGSSTIVTRHILTVEEGAPKTFGVFRWTNTKGIRSGDDIGSAQEHQLTVRRIGNVGDLETI